MGINKEDLEVAWKLNTMPKNSSPLELVSITADVETEIRAFEKMETAVKLARVKEDKKQVDWELKVKRGKVNADSKCPEQKVVVVIISDIHSPEARKSSTSIAKGGSNPPTSAAGQGAISGKTNATFLPQARSAFPCALDKRAICIGVSPAGRHDHVTHSEASRWEILWREDPTKYSPLQVPECIRSAVLDAPVKPRRYATKPSTSSTPASARPSQEPPSSHLAPAHDIHSSSGPLPTASSSSVFPGTNASPPAYAVQPGFPTGFEYYGMAPMMFPSPFGYLPVGAGGIGVPVPTSPGDLDDEIDYPRVANWLRTQVDGTRREQDGQNFAQWGDAIEQGGYLRINSLYDPARVGPEDIVNVVAEGSQVIPWGYASCILKWVEEDVKRMKREAIAAKRRRI
ncbi:hypothetical protein M407DRAFT_33833 [Tulasnella calospora MUT 4182]|uniref:Uncharacterized protein n=1 Tax=Tulasnella calospora MUT 4182 TaxID=1051891 RepID=A0A0C3K556_9AGAM|nr:hypothetical protein M407DRAFT_33833 [Tulasnella calospora MUT 4182]